MVFSCSQADSVISCGTEQNLSRAQDAQPPEDHSPTRGSQLSSPLSSWALFRIASADLSSEKEKKQTSRLA
eukprot:570669-Pelagomonas_calceolata.AAC.2